MPDLPTASKYDKRLAPRTDVRGVNSFDVRRFEFWFTALVK